MYTEKDLVGIAKRENNNKRKYLVVNRLQGKHVPANPEETFKMFDELAAIVSKEYASKKILLVGFAETATAIGARLAVYMDSYYMQTTRENIEGVDYLYFTESHSHATEQKLIKNDLDKIINEIERIIFVEDEVTTGNTILKIIDIIEKTYDRKIEFSVASILNGMDKASKDVYDLRNIKLHYLVKTNHDTYTAVAEKYATDGENISCKVLKEASYKEYTADSYSNGRRLVTGRDYELACEKLWNQIKEKIDFKKEQSVLVIGTEEFMYPAIYVANKLSAEGCTVKTHSTTRSPIAVSSEEEYPLHTRYQLSSFYDDDRKTFIYDLNRYDRVLVITDSKYQAVSGIKNITAALNKCGNTDINIIRWCE